VVSKCAYGNTPDKETANTIWDKLESKMRGEGDSDADIKFQKERRGGVVPPLIKQNSNMLPGWRTPPLRYYLTFLNSPDFSLLRYIRVSFLIIGAIMYRPIKLGTDIDRNRMSAKSTTTPKFIIPPKMIKKIKIE